MRRSGDAGNGRRGDAEKRGRGDAGKGGRGERETETRRRGDVTPSPRPRVSASPRRRFPPSPLLRRSLWSVERNNHQRCVIAKCIAAKLAGRFEDCLFQFLRALASMIVQQLYQLLFAKLVTARVDCFR